VANNLEQLAVARDSGSRHHHPWFHDGELTTKDFALGFLTSDQHLSGR
jgi:hypothetical protein